LLFAAFTKKIKTALLEFKSINKSHHKCFIYNIFTNYGIISKVTKMLFSKVNYVKNYRMQNNDRFYINIEK